MSWPFRLWCTALAIFILLPFCHGTSLWNTLYSYDDGKIYMHLKEGSLIALNFTVTASDRTLYNLKNNQQVVPLPLPPTNSSLFLVGTSLYGIAPDASSQSSNEKCADGLMSLYKYDSESTLWKQQSLDISAISDSCFYLYLSIMASPINNQSVYIFGGKSVSRGVISDRLISLNLDSNSMADITTTTTPRPFYGAANVLAPSVDSQLLIGGESQYGWLSMYQLATWNFVSGWSSHAVAPSANSSTSIESRVFSLALPIFSPIDSGSLLAIASNLTIKEVLVLGGMATDGSNCDPGITKLDLSTNIWSWQATTSSGIDPYNIAGAATILNTLVVINGLTQVLNKRDEQMFTLSLYDVSTLQPVETIQENWHQFQANSPSYTHGSNSVTMKATVGTIVPVLVVVSAIIITYFVLKHRRKQSDPVTDNFSAMEYEFGNFYSRDLPRPDTIHTTPFAGHDQSFEKMYTAEPHNGSGSTLGDESMSSWMLKKKLYEHNQIKPNDYGRSDHRLSNNDSCETISVESGLAGFSPIHSPDISLGGTPFDPITITLPITSPQTPTRLSRTGHRYSPRKPHEESDSGLILLLDETRDVQVLVSSKRRLVLRIANPDTIDDELPEICVDTVRKASGTDCAGAQDNKVRQRTSTEEADIRAAKTHQ